MRLRLPASLRGRLMLVAAATTLGAMLVAAAVMTFTLHRFIAGQVDLRLDAQAQSIAAGLRAAPNGRIDLAGFEDVPPFDRPNHGWFWQVDVAGVSRLTSNSLARRPALELDPRSDPRPGRPPGPPLRSRPAAVAGRDDLHARQMNVDVAGVPASIVVTAPEGAISGPMRDALQVVLLSMVALGTMLLAATFAQVRFGLAPLFALQRDLAAVRNGRARAVPTAQPAEIRPLTLELNALLAENAENLERARRHVANLAHGLKTPLADLALILDAPGRDPDGQARGLVDDLDLRVRHHLARARAAALGSPARAATPVSPRARDLIDAMRRIYGDKALSIVADLPADLEVACEVQDLDEMLGNLLDNACKWARSDVIISGTASEGLATLFVRDDGPGIPDERMPEALAVGRRLDEMMPGHGFGLPITRELAELYGGSVSLRRRTAGGLEALLRLPLARR